MFSPLQRNATRRQSQVSSLPYSDKPYSSRAGWMEWSWPTVGFIAIVMGLAFAGQEKRDLVLTGLEQIRDAILPGTTAPAPALDRVLVVTANTKQQLNVIATLSPRGIDPLLASNAGQVREILAQSRSRIRLAVLDETLPGSAAIARSLRAALPGDHVIVLRAGSRPDAIGPLLLGYL